MLIVTGFFLIQVTHCFLIIANIFHFNAQHEDYVRINFYLIIRFSFEFNIVCFSLSDNSGGK